MKKAVSCLLLVLGVGFAFSQAKGAIPPGQRNALIALYNNTNGDNWTNKAGWKTPLLDTDGFAMPGTENTWHGVTCDTPGNTVLYIHLDKNNLVGSIPSEIQNLVHLGYLDLSENQISGPIPPELGYLSNLKMLYLSGNQLEGPVPPEIGLLVNLERLYLNGNQLTGSIPSEMGQLTKLEVLSLGGNLLSGPLPIELSNLGNLQGFYLYENQISGNIPAEFGNLAKLVLLDLSFNQLEGPIPPGLGGLTTLRFLLINDNKLTGNIPVELGNLSRLLYLYLSGNQISGTIPAELGNLAQLNRLNLDRNQLDGPIPPELGGLTNLQILLINSNKLTGNIPSSLINLTNLSNVDLRYNGLYTTDATLRAFLNSESHNGPWEYNQTIAPANVQASITLPNSVRVTWTPIVFTKQGGYRIFYGTNSGGPYIYVGMTATKYDSQYDLSLGSLEPAPIYYFVVQTQTNPHSLNQNTVLSEFSNEAAAELGIVPLLDFLIAQISGTDIEDGIKNELVSILTNAKRSYEKGNINAVLGQMQAFQNKLKAQRGKKIPADLADVWSQIASRIIEQISANP